MKSTITLSPDEVAGLLVEHLRKKGLKVRGKIDFEGSIRYGGTAYDPDITPVFTGATATLI